MNNMYNFSTIGRPIDPKYPTNRAILIVTGVVIAVNLLGQVLAGNSLGQGILWSLGAGGAVLMAWALGRELDPDHPLSAFVGSALTFFGLLITNTLPAFLVIIWAILTNRFINRTIGPSAKFYDSVTVLLLGLWLTFQVSWWCGLITALVFFLDSYLEPVHELHLKFALGSLGGTGILFFLSRGLESNQSLTISMWLIGGVTAAIFGWLILTTTHITSVSDLGSNPLKRQRVQVAQGVALLTAVLLTVWHGGTAFILLLPLWATMLGAGGYRVYYQFVSNNS